MSQNTSVMNDFIIESVMCSFDNCQCSLPPSDKKFMYYFYKENSPEYNCKGQVINQINDIKPIEIKFICENCIKKILINGGQYILQIEKNIKINKDMFSIYLEKEGRETANPPKQGEFTIEKQYCKRCLDNQNQIKEFDLNIQTQQSVSLDTDIEIAKYYAQEQYNKDKVIFQQLQQRLKMMPNNGCNIKMEKLMILNKLKMIMQKYE